MFFVFPSDTDTWFHLISLMNCTLLILMECSHSRTSLFLCRMGILLWRHPTSTARSPPQEETNQGLWHPALAIKAWPPQMPVYKSTLGRRAPAPGERHQAGTIPAGNFCWNLPSCCLPVPWCQAQLITTEAFPYLTSLPELARKSKCNTELWPVTNSPSLPYPHTHLSGSVQSCTFGLGCLFLPKCKWYHLIIIQHGRRREIHRVWEGLKDKPGTAE